MIKPHRDRLFVKPIDAPRPESSLIAIPDTVEVKQSQFALVVNIGKLVHGGVEIGDTVILKQYSGIPCRTELDGVQIEGLLVLEDEVLAVYEGSLS